jgi:hypothetical protein
MSTYKTIRGKIVKHRRTTLRVADDGTLTIDVKGTTLTLPEAEASHLHNLMGDVLEWESSANTSEGEMDRLGDAADNQAEKLDDERAHDGR